MAKKTPQKATTKKKPLPSSKASDSDKPKRINGAKKGKQFERDVANAMGTVFPDAERMLEYQASGVKGVDLQGTGKFLFQVKRNAAYAPISRIKEIVPDSKDQVQVLITKGNKVPPIVVMYFDDWYGLMESAHGVAPLLEIPKSDAKKRIAEHTKKVDLMPLTFFSLPVIEDEDLGEGELFFDFGGSRRNVELYYSDSLLSKIKDAVTYEDHLDVHKLAIVVKDRNELPKLALAYGELMEDEILGVKVSEVLYEGNDIVTVWAVENTMLKGNERNLTIVHNINIEGITDQRAISAKIKTEIQKLESLNLSPMEIKYHNVDKLMKLEYDQEVPDSKLLTFLSRPVLECYTLPSVVCRLVFSYEKGVKRSSAMINNLSCPSQIRDEIDKAMAKGHSLVAIYTGSEDHFNSVISLDLGTKTVLEKGIKPSKAKKVTSIPEDSTSEVPAFGSIGGFGGLFGEAKKEEVKKSGFSSMF